MNTCVFCGLSEEQHGPPGQSELGRQMDRLCPGKGSQFFTLPVEPKDELTETMQDLLDKYGHRKIIAKLAELIDTEA